MAYYVYQICWPFYNESFIYLPDRIFNSFNYLAAVCCLQDKFCTVLIECMKYIPSNSEYLELYSLLLADA